MKNKKYRINTTNGIDEKIFVPINEQKQYIFIRGKDLKNPIILYLHGGPASPDSFLTYEFAYELCGKCTFVMWDQRGCGRTYFKNKSIDRENKTATFEQAINDVDELVKYLCNRFNKEKIIIMGHSYGTLLGINYVNRYPELVDRYIGIGQKISTVDANKENFYEVLEMMETDKEDTTDLVKSFEELSRNTNFTNLMNFQRKTIPYYTKNNTKVQKKNQFKLIFSSPDLSYIDFKWILETLSSKKHYMKNKQLFDYAYMANANDIGHAFSVPMFFISGDYDKSCNVKLLNAYFKKLTAPMKDIIIIENCGHSPQIDAPIQFAEAVIKILQK